MLYIDVNIRQYMHIHYMFFSLIFHLSFKKSRDIRQIKKNTIKIFFSDDKTIVNYCISLINYLFLLSSAHFKPRCKVKERGTKVKKAKTKSDLILQIVCYDRSTWADQRSDFNQRRKCDWTEINFMCSPLSQRHNKN